MRRTLAYFEGSNYGQEDKTAHIADQTYPQSIEWAIEVYDLSALTPTELAQWLDGWKSGYGITGKAGRQPTDNPKQMISVRVESDLLAQARKAKINLTNACANGIKTALKNTQEKA